MGEKKQIVRTYVGLGIKLYQALSVVGISKDQYYYRSKTTNKRMGRPVSTHTEKYVDDQTHEMVENQKMVAEMEMILVDPDTQYGYKRMTAALKLMGYKIGKNKVYRLMKENGLLHARIRPGNRKRVRGRRVDPSRPLEILTMDIKQVWVEEYARSAYILTILDTYTRVVLYRSEGYFMKQNQIKEAWADVIVNHLQPADLLKRGLTVTIRNDNGPQFAAKMVREFLHENEIEQVFTYPYCPEQNGHIESFHSILGDHLNRFHVNTLEELTQILDRFYEKYNNVRLHGSIAALPPKLFWELWKMDLVEKRYTKRGRVKFIIKMPYWKLSGNANLREFPLFKQAC